MLNFRVVLVGLVRHAVSGLYYAATVVAMAAAYYSLRGFGAVAGWAGVVGVFLFSLGLYLCFPRRKAGPGSTD
jgi:predicted membrane-bound spermidine synthase